MQKTGFENLFSKCMNSHVSVGISATILLTSLYSLVVVMVAYSNASVVSFMRATLSLDITPTTNADKLFAAIQNVGVDCTIDISSA